LKFVHARIQAPRPTDPFFTRIQDQPVERLRRQFQTLARQAERLLEYIAASGR